MRDAQSIMHNYEYAKLVIIFWIWGEIRAINN